MDVVYICRDGENEELRYSLRSLGNLPHENVWLIGGAPNWYKGQRVKVRQDRNKYESARRNLNAIVECQRISDNFVLMNDDFFILEPVEKIEYMYSRPFSEFLAHYRSWAGNNVRTKIMADTLETLLSLGIEQPLDYELHVPMVFNKRKLAKVLPYGVAVRSLYGNIYQVGGVKTKDVKYHEYRSGGPEAYDIDNRTSPFLSSSDRTFRIVHNRILKRLFTQPSPYEQV